MINSLKDWLNNLQDSNIPQRERMYRLMTTVGLFALFVAFCAGMFLESNLVAPLLILTAWMLLFLLVRYTIRANRISLGIMLIATLLLFLLIPLSFFTGGGLYGGAPIWFVFSYVYCALLMEKPARGAFLFATSVVMLICYYLAYTHPEFVSTHTTLAAYVDSFLAIALLSGIIVALIVFQHNSYRRKSRHSEEQRLEILELNQAQNRFFSSMSHEIRTPINTIIGLNEMNLRENLSSEVEDNSLHIQQASRILLALINDILDMSKIESGKMNLINEPYSVANLLSEIVSMIMSSAQSKGLTLQVDADKNLPAELVGDEVRIKQILINILNNSIKYTNEGTITFSIQFTRMENNTALVSYSITDTGIGIKKESIPYLFSAFRREDEMKNRHIEGTGLGLSIVKQLVDLMDGRIAVNSVYTKGSTFTVTIPQPIVSEEVIGEFDLEKYNANRARNEYVQKFEAPTAKVLIVDDNEVNLLVEEKLLRKTQVNVETVTSGKACLERTLETHYDIILMDHLMPEMDGIETLHALRNQHGGLNRETPTLVLTANAGSDLIAMYKREGFDDVILKPVSGELLEEKLMTYLPNELLIVTYDETPQTDDNLPIQTYTRKRPIIVSSESVCDLPPQVIKARGIEIISHNIYTDEGYFLDGKEIDSNAILAHLDHSSDAKASTKAPTVEAYEEFFANLLQKAQVIIHITPSKKSSMAFKNAAQAASSFDNIAIIDSGHISSSMGMVVLRAATMADMDETPDAIIKEMSKMRTLVQTSFCLNNLNNVAASGRAPKRAIILSTAFMMHPIVGIQDGVMRPLKIIFGNRQSAWTRYVNLVFSEPSSVDTSVLYIAYSGLSQNELNEIENRVRAVISFERIIFQRVSASSSTIFGSGTFGLLFAKRGDKL